MLEKLHKFTKNLPEKILQVVPAGKHSLVYTHKNKR